MLTSFLVLYFSLHPVSPLKITFPLAEVHLWVFLLSSVLLLLLLIRFSRVRLCATPQMAAHQAPLSLGFSRQEHGVGCHFLLQCMKVKSENEVAQSCPTLRDPMDCSPPGSSVHGISQARVLTTNKIITQALVCSVRDFHGVNTPTAAFF